MPKISVIVPVYNAENEIEKCVNCLLNQSYSDYEIIFINDGSTDNSLKILEKSLAENVHIISQVNQGQAQARNAGIHSAKGEFICFVDIDDHISLNYLEELIIRQQEDDADIVWCNATLYKDTHKVETLDNPSVFLENPFKNYFMHNASPWRKLIRTSLIKENDLYFPPLRFYEDLAIMPVIGLYADKISYVDQPLYDYVLHAGSSMHQSKYNPKLEEIFDSLDYLESKVKHSDKINLKEEMEFLYIDHLLHAASLRFLSFDRKESLDRVVSVMAEKYSDWQQNKYFRQKDWQYRLICRLFYKKRYGIVKLLLK